MQASAGVEIDLALLILRLFIGLTFAAHGAQKAFGWWEGPGFAGWTGVMGRMGLEPRLLWASVSTGAELLGGLALAVGFLTPLAAALLVAQAVVIIGRAHWPKGFWNTKGGYEYPLTLLGGALAVLVAGPGTWALDTLVPVGVLYLPVVKFGALAVTLAVALFAVTRPRPQQPPTKT